MAIVRITRISGAITLLITIFSLSLPAYAQYSGGTGEPNDPYQIATAEDLMLLGETPEDYDKHFILTADIDFGSSPRRRMIFYKAIIAPSNNESTPWEFNGSPFIGVFNGNGHTISYLKITGKSYLGLFGQLGFGAKITNLGLESVDIEGSSYYIGSLAAENGGSISNCYSTGTVNGNIYVGGLVSFNNGNIETSHSTCMVSGNRYVGGLVADNSSWISTCSIADCYSTGTVNGERFVGGITGSNSGNITISQSTGTIMGISYVGGIVGENEGSILNCFSTGVVIGETDVGGLVGYNMSRISNSYSTNKVRGYEYVGGLTGGNSGEVIDCYSTVMIRGHNNIGGLIGGNNGDVIDCYCIATVSAYGQYSQHVGGLVGSNGCMISNSYSASAVSGTDIVGGLLGDNTGDVIQCYSMSTTYGNYNVGGLVGYNKGSVNQCYSVGTTYGNDNVGGLVGSNGYFHVGLTTIVRFGGSISECYSTGGVSGRHAVGGLVGRHILGEVANSFWDVESSGLKTSDGGNGKTTSEMQVAKTFVEDGWNFSDETTNGTDNVWGIIEDSYPKLWWEGRYGEPIAAAPILSEKLIGEGTEDSPYLIYTAEQLDMIGMFPYDWHRHFKLMADIDLSDYFYYDALIAPDMEPDIWMFDGTSFTGVFDGNGHTISHLKIFGSSNLGLFGRLESGAEVMKLGVIDINIIGHGYHVGGLVGSNHGGHVTACFSTGVINSLYRVGGLIGSNWDGGSVSCCYSSAKVSGSTRVGGLVGYNHDDVIQCYSMGIVRGSMDVGGLVGWNFGDAVVTSCFWDIEASGRTNMCGSQGDYATGCDNTYGKTTTEMQTAATFLEAGWDFVDEVENGTDDIWWIDEGNDYPRLWWEVAVQ